MDQTLPLGSEDDTGLRSHMHGSTSEPSHLHVSGSILFREGEADMMTSLIQSPCSGIQSGTWARAQQWPAQLPFVCFLSRCLLGWASGTGQLHSHAQPHPQNIYETVIRARHSWSTWLFYSNGAATLGARQLQDPYPSGEDVRFGTVKGLFMDFGATGLSWDIRMDATRFRKRRDG